jgi:hypothetical protein
MDERYGDRMLIAEANQWLADVRPQIDDGDELRRSSSADAAHVHGAA